MRITVFGAAGAVGSRVVTEALSRGHHVTAVVRDPARYRAPQLVPAHPGAALTVGAGDASDLTDALRLSTGQDLVITATRPALGREDDLVTTTKTLLAAARASATRLLVVGGAATLTVPGSGGATVLDDPAHLPAAYRPIALACAAQLETCRTDTDTDWAYLSPAAQLLPGVRTGGYRLGADELLLDADGISAISMEDLAVALLDEAEHPRHRRTRFTAAY
ncbi:NAD(P)-dependent oxidoreductase [Nonomuraea africana]|uniref:NADH-flavin reductase n=1 Tax=Nonomuraea africana TaxID=46171 RepID=A0ABR9KCJ2_9ACTN|nr:NAD(P)H-binding protein [Nonomuraea africana]MBE1559732.1 putative NADH-flavin reductase [Nonomuraea africana]